MSEPVYLFDKNTTERSAAEAVDRAYRAYCLYDGMTAYADVLRRERARHPEGLPWGLLERLITIMGEASLSMHHAWSLTTTVHGLAERPVTRPRAKRKAVRA